MKILYMIFSLLPLYSSQYSAETKPVNGLRDYFLNVRSNPEYWDNFPSDEIQIDFSDHRDYDHSRSDTNFLPEIESFIEVEPEPVPVVPAYDESGVVVVDTERGKNIFIPPVNYDHQIEINPAEESGEASYQEVVNNGVPDGFLEESNKVQSPALDQISSSESIEDSDSVENSKDDGELLVTSSTSSAEELDIEGSGETFNRNDQMLQGRVVNIFEDGSEPVCTTPRNETGHCRHFSKCAMHDILNNFNMYLEYLCRRRGGLGICCPDKPIVTADPKEKNISKPVLETKQPEDGCGINRRHRIVGGEVSKPHEWVWMAALLKRDRFFCGGALVNNHFVLTAAHCTLGLKIKDITVRLGEYNFDFKTVHQRDIPVAEIRSHRRFSTFTFQHDIALLRLARPVEYSRTIGTICLPDSDRDFTNVNATVVGWGTVSFGGATSPVLRQVTIPVWSNAECDRVFSTEKINRSFLCAGMPDDKQDACQGDSGGPLMIMNSENRWEVIGLVSWGRRCGDPDYPGVYTRVTTYLDWIKENSH